jgi:hypothetical protein
MHRHLPRHGNRLISKNLSTPEIRKTRADAEESRGVGVMLDLLNLIESKNPRQPVGDFSFA